jgi:DNA-binding NtrC family response regulator
MKIVIIDDEPLMGEIIESYLSSLPAEFSKFTNIQEAAQFMKSNKVDLVISDFYMPEGSGLDFVNQLRSMEDLTPVVLISGSHVSGQDSMKFAAFIKKPCPPKELLNIVQSITNSTRTQL